MDLQTQALGPFEWRNAPTADFAVIGDPVAHSLSPQMHGAAYAALGLPHRYVSIRVPAGEVSMALDHLRALGYQGVNVTVPHKHEVFGWLAGIDEFAWRADAVNCVDLRAGFGLNTDAPGFLDTLADVGVRPAAHVLMLGAGGSARALSLALVLAGYRLSIWNRTHAKAVALVQDLGIEAEVLDSPILGDVDVVVNATSIAALSHKASTAGAVEASKSKTGSSKGEGAIAIPWDQASQSLIAYDLFYAKEPTPFLAQAQERGLQTVDGLPLLIAQGALAFEYWLGLPAPREVMSKAVH